MNATQLSRIGVSLDGGQLINWVNGADKNEAKILMELPWGTLVLALQAQTGMWTENESVLDKQIDYYQHAMYVCRALHVKCIGFDLVTIFSPTPTDVVFVRSNN